MKKNKIMCSPDNMTFYVENPKESTEKSIDPTKKHYNKGFQQGCKILSQHTKSILFLQTSKR